MSGHVKRCHCAIVDCSHKWGQETRGSFHILPNWRFDDALRKRVKNLKYGDSDRKNGPDVEHCSTLSIRYPVEYPTWYTSSYWAAWIGNRQHILLAYWRCPMLEKVDCARHHQIRCPRNLDKNYLKQWHRGTESAVKSKNFPEQESFRKNPQLNSFKKPPHIP
jgi:hypothetical protein